MVATPATTSRYAAYWQVQSPQSQGPTGDMAREPAHITEQRRQLGERLATCRRAAELTQAQLAALLHYNRSSLAHVERGHSRADERFWRQADEACQAGGLLLTGFHELEAAKVEHQRAARVRDLDNVRAKVARLRADIRQAHDQRQTSRHLPMAETASRPFLPEVTSRLADAMLAAGNRPVVDDELLALPELTARVKRAWQLRQQAAYVALGDYLTDLIPIIEASVANLSGDKRSAALKLLVHTYNAASSLLKRLGDVELALMAADRAVRTARALDAPLLVAAASYRLANVLLTTARLHDARTVALAAADSVAPDKTRSPLGLASWGGLLLTGAVASARLHDASGAWELLGEARTASRMLGIEYADIHTIFGPTNVAIHGVQVAAELGNGHAAVQRSERVDPDRLPASLRERHGQFLIDLAHGHVLLQSDGRAIESLLQAERAAPEEVSFNPTTHYLVRTMLERERVSATPGLRGLARRIGVEQ